MLIGTARSVGFDDILGGGTPEWTMDDLGMAVQGLEPLYFAAFAYRWADDAGGHSMLRAELVRAGTQMALREKWVYVPDAGSPAAYIDKLADMVLLEERHPSIFRMAFMWPTIMGVGKGVWEKVLSSKYEGIRAMYEAWVSIAHHHMMERLRACEFDRGY